LIDGGLSAHFQAHIPEAHWQRIETATTGAGVADLNGCYHGIEVWIELKLTAEWSVALSPFQVSWAERRIRYGGRVYIAVRRNHPQTKRTQFADELYLFHGSEARHLMDGGIRGATCLGMWANGPALWDWAAVRKIIFAGG
jgi:hypothetical protein